jgi:hypothetical protein
VGDLLEKDKNGQYKDSNIYLYHYNPVTSKLETLPYSSSYRVDKNGYTTIRILHCSDYIALPQKADTTLITTMKDQISTIKKEYTLSLKGTKKAKVELKLPATLELVPTLKTATSGDAVGAVIVSYTSSNERIVTVDKNGNITTVDKGKAYINVKITLYYHQTKTIKIPVTVK